MLSKQKRQEHVALASVHACDSTRNLPLYDSLLSGPYDPDDERRLIKLEAGREGSMTIYMDRLQQSCGPLRLTCLLPLPSVGAMRRNRLDKEPELASHDAVFVDQLQQG